MESVPGRLAPVLKTVFINVSYHIFVASLTLVALSNRAIRVRLATSIHMICHIDEKLF